MAKKDEPPSPEDQRRIIKSALDEAKESGIAIPAFSAALGLRPKELQDCYEGRGIRDPAKWKMVSIYLEGKYQKRSD